MSLSSKSKSIAVQKSRPKICVSVAQHNLDAMFSDAEKAFGDRADMVELRLDFLQPLDLQAVKKKFKSVNTKLILTLRKKDEGGKFEGVEHERIKLLKEIQLWKGAYKDVELSTISGNATLLKDAANTIVSWHDFNSTPSEQILRQKLSIALKYGGLAKIVTTAKALSDNVRVLSLYNKSPRGRLVAFCMGEQGKISRIVAPILGSPFMYGCLDGAAVAPGQMPVSELRGFYELFKLA